MFKLLFFSVLQGDHEDVLEKFGDNELGEEARRLLKDPLRSRLAASGLLPAVSAPEKGTQGMAGRGLWGRGWGGGDRGSQSSL